MRLGLMRCMILQGLISGLFQLGIGGFEILLEWIIGVKRGWMET